MGLAEEWTKAAEEEEGKRKVKVLWEDLRYYLRAGASARARCLPLDAAAQIRDLLAEDFSDEEDAVDEGVGDKLERAAAELEEMAGVPRGSSGPPRRMPPVVEANGVPKSTGESQEEESAPPSSSEDDSEATSASVSDDEPASSSDDEPAAAAAAARKRKSEEDAAAAAPMANGTAASMNGTGKKKAKKSKAEL